MLPSLNTLSKRASQNESSSMNMPKSQTKKPNETRLKELLKLPLADDCSKPCNQSQVTVNILLESDGKSKNFVKLNERIIRYIPPSSSGQDYEFDSVTVLKREPLNVVESYAGPGNTLAIIFSTSPFGEQPNDESLFQQTLDLGIFFEKYLNKVHIEFVQTDIAIKENDRSTVVFHPPIKRRIYSSEHALDIIRLNKLTSTHPPGSITAFEFNFEPADDFSEIPDDLTIVHFGLHGEPFSTPFYAMLDALVCRHQRGSKNQSHVECWPDLEDSSFVSWIKSKFSESLKNLVFVSCSWNVLYSTVKYFSNLVCTYW